MNGSNPTISVLLPVFNAKKHLRHALQSILGQSFRDFEVVAIDDGSDDGSHLVLQEAASHDRRVRVVVRGRRGLVATLAECAELANGEFLARMDADDVCEPQRFERQLTALRQNSECVAVSSVVLQVDPNGRPLCTSSTYPSHEAIDQELLTQPRGTLAFPHPAAMIRASAYLAVGGYDRSLPAAEDRDLFLKLAEIGHLMLLPEPLLRYRLHFNSFSLVNNHVQSKCRMFARKRAYTRRGLPWLERDATTIPESLGHAETLARWANLALRGGNRGVALRNALAAIVRNPLGTTELATIVRCIFAYCRSACRLRQG